MEIYKLNKCCRLCGHLELKDILSLGNQCIAAFVDGENAEPLIAPLELVLCQNCNLLQLKHTTSPDVLYTDNYGYRTALNSTMIQEMKNIVGATVAQKQLEKGDVVVDIGASDGTLLQNYPPGIIKVAFEPVSKFSSYLEDIATFHFTDFFNAAAFRERFGDTKVKVITVIAMFYDLDNPNSFLNDIKELLDPEGILVIQQNYLPKMLVEGTFDNISHEHVAYYSLTTLQKLLAKHNLEVFDVSESPINGGCFRTFIAFKGKRAVEPRVHAMEDIERKLPEDIYQRFLDKVKENVDRLSTFVKAERFRGKRFFIYGASTRGNVILQAAGLDRRFIDGASERNPEKWGKRTLGTDIPIYSEHEARKIQPDYFLILPYWFKDEFIEREREYLRAGGALVFPLPQFEVFYYRGKLQSLTPDSG